MGAVYRDWFHHMSFQKGIHIKRSSTRNDDSATVLACTETGLVFPQCSVMFRLVLPSTSEELNNEISRSTSMEHCS